MPHHDQLEEKLASIRKRLPVSFSPLTIREHRLKLLEIDDITPLIGDRDPFEDVSSFPFWAKTWEASLVLADLLCSMDPPQDSNLLELGAGLGLPGLAAAAHGYQVTMTDFEEQCLACQEVSALASGVAERVRHLRLDWLNPPEELGRFATIVGAEILFREEFFEPLLGLFRDHLEPGGVIYLAHEITRKSLPLFLRKAEAEYVIAVSQRKITSDDGERTIIVNRLTPRNA